MASTTLTDSEKETNRSDKEYAFDEEQSDAILGKIGVYHHNIASVVQYSPEDHAHVLPSLKTCSDLALSNLGLGSLERLPIELLHEMLLHLDISSVFKFRQINPRAREFVDSIHQYQALVSHGINLFRGLLQTGLARQKSLSDFFELFCTMKCSFCENFGGDPKAQPLLGPRRLQNNTCQVGQVGDDPISSGDIRGTNGIMLPGNDLLV
ncbi:unnamed protein product [Penicillium bialowiezense]